MSDSQRERAAEREEELGEWRRRLVGPKPLTERDVQLSKHRLDEARIRAKEAFERDAYLHYEAGAAYERAAEAHKLAMEAGIGDVWEHERAMEEQLEAARRELSKAQEALLEETAENQSIQDSSRVGFSETTET